MLYSVLLMLHALLSEPSVPSATCQCCCSLIEIALVKKAPNCCIVYAVVWLGVTGCCIIALLHISCKIQQIMALTMQHFCLNYSIIEPYYAATSTTMQQILIRSASRLLPRLLHC
jgi:hypothetical protein